MANFTTPTVVLLNNIAILDKFIYFIYKPLQIYCHPRLIIILVIINIMITWYPTVVAMVRMITTNVIAAWLAIVELLKIVMYWVIVMIMKLLNKNPKHIGFGDYCDICNAVYYAFSICQCIALIINLMGHN